MSSLSMAKKGFTLVELLIVIVVIGVLSAMMMLSSTEAVSSAKASNIISNMRNIKTAALSFYADNMGALTSGSEKMLDPSKIADIGTGTANYFGDIVKSNPSIIKKYLGNNSNFSLNEEAAGSNYCKEGGYTVGCADHGKRWYVIYRFANNESSVKAKITSRAASIGLLGHNAKNPDAELTTVYNNHPYVILKIMDLS